MGKTIDTYEDVQSLGIENPQKSEHRRWISNQTQN